MLDDLTDRSGYGNNATQVGTASYGISLVADSIRSRYLNSANTLSFPVSVYQRGKEHKSFTLLATIRTVGVSSQQKILSSTAAYDGLTVNGTTIKFSTEYETSAAADLGAATCSHDIGDARKIDVAAVHTPQKNSLYIDGVLVDEVDVSSEQQAGRFKNQTASLVCGETLGSQGLLVNSVAVYGHVLQPEDIYSVYLLNNRRVEASAAQMHGGTDLPLTFVRVPEIYHKFNLEESWNFGEHNGTLVDEDSLHAEIQSDLTVAGQWLTSVAIQDEDAPVTIDSVNLDWSGVGETVSVSLDGETWTQATKNTNLSIIPEGFDPTGKALFIKVDFTAGLSEAYVSELEVNGYISDTAPTGGRTVTYQNPAVVREENVPIMLSDDWGVALDHGWLEFSQETLLADFSTIEIWLKIEDNDTDFVLFDSRSVGNTTAPNESILATGPANNFSGNTTRYVNGVASATGPRTGEWAVVHLVLPAAVAQEFKINTSYLGGSSGNIKVGKVALYPNQLTAADIDEIVKDYTGINSIVENDPSVVAVAESAQSTSIYGHDWEIVAS